MQGYIYLHLELLLKIIIYSKKKEKILNFQIRSILQMNINTIQTVFYYKLCIKV